MTPISRAEFLSYIIKTNLVEVNLVKRDRFSIFYYKSALELALPTFVKGLIDLLKELKYETYFVEMAIFLILDKINLKSAGFDLTEDNIRRLLLVSVLEVCKTYDDEGALNLDFAMLSGLKLSVVSQLEYEFLKKIHYEMNISKEKFCQTLQDWLCKFEKNLHEENVNKKIDFIHECFTHNNFLSTMGNLFAELDKQLDQGLANLKNWYDVTVPFWRSSNPVMKIKPENFNRLNVPYLSDYKKI